MHEMGSNVAALPRPKTLAAYWKTSAQMVRPVRG
jgi:hypothetical protein